MSPKERRRHFFINKPLQLRYMLTFSLPLLVITLVSLAGLYFGIWGEVLDSFSDERILNDLLTASRLEQYEEARRSPTVAGEFSSLTFFRQAERLSARQQEAFKEILNKTNRSLAGKFFILLALIAAGTVFLSHKLAGPLYRFEAILSQMKRGEVGVRCHLRKFDEAQSVAQAMNETLEALDLQISQMKKIVRENERSPERLIPLLKEKLAQFKTSEDS